MNLFTFFLITTPILLLVLYIIIALILFHFIETRIRILSVQEGAGLVLFSFLVACGIYWTILYFLHP